MGSSHLEVVRSLPILRTYPPVCIRTFAIPPATMSVTTTANPITYNISSVLADYELTHSDSNTPLDTTLNVHPRSASSPNPEIPCDWPTDHRRVPTYRPINTELDQSQRRVYQNPIERAFIAVMFSGVFIESVSRRRRCEMTRVPLILSKDCF
jgi:hypothetical protein